jgi:molybdenum cofactor cytidylyltransferase
VIPAIVLAAGASSRMGRTKALLETDRPGETFLGRLVSTLRQAGVEDVVVVVGRDPEVRAAAEAAGARVVENREPDRGQLSSLVTGLDVVDRPGVRGALVALVDAPLVSVGTVRAVLDEYRRGGGGLVRPANAGRHGHPAVFDRTLFPELRRADPAAGARAVVRRTTVREVEVADAGAFEDIDTPADYERLFGRAPGSPAGWR